MDEFLSLQEAANYLKVEYKTIYRLVRGGEIPAGKIGGVYRIRKSDIDHFFEKQKETLRKSAVTVSNYAVCAACHREIYSRLGSPGQCRVCGEPLCVNCWSVDGKRSCAQHERTDHHSLETPSREAATMSKNSDHEQEAHPANQEAKPQNEGHITAQSAKLLEESFIGRFDTKVRQLDTVRNPITGEEFVIKNWKDHHTSSSDKATLPLLLPAQALKTKKLENYPLNLRSRYEIPKSSYTLAKKKQSRLILEAYFFSHLKSYLVDGHDSQPISTSELFPMIGHYAKEIERQNALCILGVASATGWEESAIEHVRAEKKNEGYRNPFLAIVLIDGPNRALIYNKLDERLTGWVSLFEFESQEERIEQVISYVKTSLLKRESVSLPQAVEELGISDKIVEKAFRQLGKKKGYALDEFEDLGLVISEKI